MYAQIQAPEIAKLATMKASGLATQTYMVLAMHDWGKGYSFPSIQTISEKLGNAYHIKSIHRALKWLEDNLFIKRKEATSKQRFSMVLRKIKTSVTKAFQRAPESYHKNQMKRRNNPSYYSKRKTNKISKSQKRIQYINEVWGAVKDVLDDKRTHEWFTDPQNSDIIKSMNLKPYEGSAPTERPSKYSNKDVYEAIRTNIPDEPKEYIDKIFQYWLSLTPA